MINDECLSADMARRGRGKTLRFLFRVLLSFENFYVFPWIYSVFLAVAYLSEVRCTVENYGELRGMGIQRQARVRSYFQNINSTADISIKAE